MQLLITSDVEASRAVSFGERGVFRVGRGAECEVRLVDPTASRCHAELRVDDGRVWVKDAGSRFGTFVNGVKTAEGELRPGDVVLIGETTLTLEDGAREIRTTIAPGAERWMGASVRAGLSGDDDEDEKTPHPNPLPTKLGRGDKANGQGKADGQECPASDQPPAQSLSESPAPRHPTSASSPRCEPRHRAAIRTRPSSPR